MIYDFNGKSPDIDKTSYISPSVDVIGDVSIGHVVDDEILENTWNKINE